MVIRIALVKEQGLVVQGVASMPRHRDDFKPVDAATRAGIDIALVDTFAVAGEHDRTLARLVADPGVGKVVIYTWNFQPWAAPWVRRGVSGYLSKSLPSATLVEALRAIHHGRTIVAPGQEPGLEHGLTAREAEVLSLIAAGLTNAQVAEQTRLSINSIKSYVRSCYRKIDVDSRSQAILWGLSPRARRPSRRRAVGDRRVGVDRACQRHVMAARRPPRKGHVTLSAAKPRAYSAVAMR